VIPQLQKIHNPEWKDETQWANDAKPDQVWANRRRRATSIWNDAVVNDERNDDNKEFCYKKYR